MRGRAERICAAGLRPEQSASADAPLHPGFGFLTGYHVLSDGGSHPQVLRGDQTEGRECRYLIVKNVAFIIDGFYQRSRDNAYRIVLGRKRGYTHNDEGLTFRLQKTPASRRHDNAALS